MEKDKNRDRDGEDGAINNRDTEKDRAIETRKGWVGQQRTGKRKQHRGTERKRERQAAGERDGDINNSNVEQHRGIEKTTRRTRITTERQRQMGTGSSTERYRAGQMGRKRKIRRGRTTKEQREKERYRGKDGEMEKNSKNRDEVSCREMEKLKILTGSRMEGEGQAE